MEEAGKSNVINEVDVKAEFVAFYSKEYLQMLDMRDANIVEYMWTAFANGWKCRSKYNG